MGLKFLKVHVISLLTEQRMCLGTFSRLRRSLATSTLYAAVRILAERFLLYRKAISCKVKKRESMKDSLEKGDNQIRTGDKGVADPCLTTWLCRHILL